MIPIQKATYRTGIQESAIRLHDEGLNIKQIADELVIDESYLRVIEQRCQFKFRRPSKKLEKLIPHGGKSDMRDTGEWKHIGTVSRQIMGRLNK